MAVAACAGFLSSIPAASSFCWRTYVAVLASAMLSGDLLVPISDAKKTREVSVSSAFFTRPRKSFRNAISALDVSPYASDNDVWDT